MKYGQLVEKVPNSTTVFLWYSPSYELYAQLLKKVSISFEIARKKQFQMNWGQLLEKVSISVEIARKKQFQMNWGQLLEKVSISVTIARKKQFRWIEDSS